MLLGGFLASNSLHDLVGQKQVIPLTFHNNNTCNYSICKKRFEKGFLAEIYSLCASEQLLIYLHPIFSQKQVCAYVITQDICSKFFEVNFYVGRMVLRPNRL